MAEALQVLGPGRRGGSRPVPVRPRHRPRRGLRDADRRRPGPGARRRRRRRRGAARQPPRTSHASGAGAPLRAGRPGLRALLVDLLPARPPSTRSRAASYDEALHQAERAVELQDRDAVVTDAEREATLLLVGRALVRLGRPATPGTRCPAPPRSALDRGDTAGAAAQPCSCSPRSSCGAGGRPRAGTDDAVALWRRVLDADPAVYPGRAGAAPCLPGLRAVPAARRRRALPPRPRPRSARPARTVPGGRADPRAPGAITALQRPELRARRVPLYDELVELATRQGEHAALANTLTQRAVELAALGQLDRFRSDVARARELARSPRPSGDADRHRAPGGAGPRGGLRLGGGRPGPRRDRRARGDAGSSSVGLTLVHRAVIAEEQGRLGDLEPALEHDASSTR